MDSTSRAIVAKLENSPKLGGNRVTNVQWERSLSGERTLSASCGFCVCPEHTPKREPACAGFAQSESYPSPAQASAFGACLAPSPQLWDVWLVSSAQLKNTLCPGPTGTPTAGALPAPPVGLGSTRLRAQGRVQYGPMANSPPPRVHLCARLAPPANMPLSFKMARLPAPSAAVQIRNMLLTKLCGCWHQAGVSRNQLGASSESLSPGLFGMTFSVLVVMFRSPHSHFRTSLCPCVYLPYKPQKCILPQFSYLFSMGRKHMHIVVPPSPHTPPFPPAQVHM
jgi:hypothetical protein